MSVHDSNHKAIVSSFVGHSWEFLLPTTAELDAQTMTVNRKTYLHNQGEFLHRFVSARRHNMSQKLSRLHVNIGTYETPKMVCQSKRMKRSMYSNSNELARHVHQKRQAHGKSNG